MRKTKKADILAALLNEPFGTRFHFENGYVVMKSKEDYGFTGCLPCFYQMYPLPTWPRQDHQIGYYADRWRCDWDEGWKNTIIISDEFSKVVRKYGALILIEHGNDPWHPEPLFT